MKTLSKKNIQDANRMSVPEVVCEHLVCEDKQAAISGERERVKLHWRSSRAMKSGQAIWVRCSICFHCVIHVKVVYQPHSQSNACELDDNMWNMVTSGGYAAWWLVVKATFSSGSSGRWLLTWNILKCQVLLISQMHQAATLNSKHTSANGTLTWPSTLSHPFTSEREWQRDLAFEVVEGGAFVKDSLKYKSQFCQKLS